MLLRLLFGALAAARLVLAESQQRNPLQYLTKVELPEIQTSGHRVNAFSKFDLAFSLYDSGRRLTLSLEPNEDVIPPGAVVTYLDDKGSVAYTESIDRKDHRVYKGTVRSQWDDGSWIAVGWARITIHRDGPQPLFEGAFSVNHDNHHVQLSSSYTRTKHDLDPELEPSEDEFMVVYRDSDVSSTASGSSSHTDLKRDLGDFSCYADQLEFNTRHDHPIFRPIVKRAERSWGVMPVAHMLGKRQIDTQPGAGNTGGVDLSSTIGQSLGCPSTKKVALVGVATDCGYTGSFPSSSALRKTVINLMNSASHVWESTFNISLGLQNLTVSPANCPGTEQATTPWNRACDSGLDIQDRLNLFSGWRGGLDDSNSHWTMLTKCRTGTSVGLAWLGQACVQNSITTNSTTGSGSETVSGANVVALSGSEWQIIAHETGHTFGAVHDCDSSTCGDTAYVRSQQCCPFSASTCSADSQFIMNPFITVGVSQFSPCTVGNICSAILRNSVNTSCLSANQGIVTITGQQCGNGIVEEGEECDCGTEADCQGNTCCDPTTCKFMNGAVCDDLNQDCCNNCQFAPKNTVCRASTGTCDPEEKCSGEKAVCPKDVTAPNGRACSIADAPAGAGDLTCASGQCTSRNLQCQTVMGSFTKKSNDTYACDDSTCLLSCGSPVFGPNLCYSLQQNMLDGTPCGGGGHCQNGQCDGSSFGQEVLSWIDAHKGVVIGVAVGVGVLLLIFVISCFCGRMRRRKRARGMGKKGPSPPPPTWYGPPPVPSHGTQQAVPADMQPPVSGSPRRSPNQGQSWGHDAQPGWRPPQSSSPGPAALYGSGILGSRGSGPQEPSEYPVLLPPGYYGNFGAPSSARYA